MTSQNNHRTRLIGWAAASAAVAALIAGAALYFSPYWTLHRMRAAIQAQDPAAFSRHVDLAAVKDELTGQLMQRAVQDTRMNDSRLSGLGRMLAVGLFGQMLDVYLSPASLMRMVAEGKATVNRADLLGTPGQAPAPRYTLRYADWSTAVLRAEDASAFVFTREGLWSWQLTALALAP